MELNGVNKKTYSQKKLVADFRNRIEYVCHVENLKFYLERGMKLLKVHEIISFDQSSFAKKFISETTKKRSSSSSKIEKGMWKFFNNVLFGKSLQDASKNIDVDIMWRNIKANEKCRRANFRGRMILDTDTIAIASTPLNVSRKMAFAVGFSILEFSKLEMYKAWYDKIYPNFPNAELCTSDTDSFLFSVKSKNLYQDLSKIDNFWDFSTLPKDHLYYNPTTANQLGLFKLETGADKIFACAGNNIDKKIDCKSSRFIYYYKIHFFSPGCRPKVYSADTIAWNLWKEYEKIKKPKCMRKVKKETVKRMKGVKSHLVRQEFTHKCYVRAILTGKPRFVKYFTINSRMNKVSTYKKGKLGLSGKTRFSLIV